MYITESLFISLCKLNKGKNVQVKFKSQESRASSFSRFSCHFEDISSPIRPTGIDESLNLQQLSRENGKYKNL